MFLENAIIFINCDHLNNIPKCDRFCSFCRERFSTRLLAFNYDEFVIIMRYAKLTYSTVLKYLNNSAIALHETKFVRCDLLNSQALALKLVYNQTIGFVLTCGGIGYEALGKSRYDRKRTF